MLFLSHSLWALSVCESLPTVKTCFLCVWTTAHAKRWSTRRHRGSLYGGMLWVKKAERLDRNVCEMSKNRWLLCLSICTLFHSSCLSFPLTHSVCMWFLLGSGVTNYSVQFSQSTLVTLINILYLCLRGYWYEVMWFCVLMYMWAFWNWEHISCRAAMWDCKVFILVC